MADNVITDAGSGGASFVTREIAHAGDTSQLSGSFIMGISGSEGSYTAAAINGDATNGLDVDVTRVIPGVSATHLGKAEDAAHVSGDTGVAILAVRRDAVAVGSGADGDYSTLNVDASGRLWSHDPVAVALLATIDVDTDSMSTDLGTIAGAVVAGQMQVDVVAALPAGDNNIGNVDIASSVALDVSAATVTVDNGGTFAVQLAAGAASIGKAEDVASADADVGVPAMARRTATPADTSGADLDYEMLQMDNGRLWVSAKIDAALPAGTNEIGKLAAGVAEIGNVKNSGVFATQATLQAGTAEFGKLAAGVAEIGNVKNSGTFATQATLQAGTAEIGKLAAGVAEIGNVKNAGTFAVQVDGDALTALQLIDDAIFADDAAFTLVSSKVMAAGGIRDDTLSALAAAEGDVVPFRVNANGALHVTGSSGSTQYSEDAAHSTGDTGTMGLFVRNDALGALVDTDGDYAPGQVNASGALYVEAALSATDNAVLDNIDTQTSPATSHYRNIDANAEAAIKASAGVLHWLHVMNLTAAKAYLHLYDATTGNVDPGTTVPDFTFPIPTKGDTDGAGFNLPLGPNGQSFANAITLVVTTTIDGSSGDPGTNGVFVNAGYE